MASAVSQRQRSATDDHHAAPPAKRARTSRSDNGSRSGAKGSSRLEKAISHGAAKKLAAASTRPAQNAKRHQVDENEAVISKKDGHGDAPLPGEKATANVVEISSDSSGSSSSEDESEVEPDSKVNARKSAAVNGTKAKLANGVKGEQGEEDAMDVDEAESPEAGLTFGELAAQSEPIDVEASMAEDNPDTALAYQTHNTLQPPSSNSLSTVLSQALRTNDAELLESCFQVNDLDSVRTTIERLDSSLVASLLRKLAEKIHRRPGRAGILMVWVQWTLVSHGGYLAGQPDVLAQVGSLSRVIKERATGLQPLLTLKGKLDMLSAQLEFRRSVQARAKLDEDDEEAVIYVEGEEDEEEEKDDAESSEDDEDGPHINGIDVDTKLGVQRTFEDSEDESSEEEGDKDAVNDGFSEHSVESEPDSEESDDDQSHDESEVASPPPKKGRSKKA
jgi:U3 small nucleolar RNA-associated protein 5